MRKTTLLFIGCVLAVASCKKSDIRTSPSTEQDLQTTQQVADAGDRGRDLQRRCAAHDVLLRQIAADPERGRRLEALERIIQQRSATMKGKPPGSGGGGGESPSRSLITIPVVVHVVLPNPSQVSEQQISSQLAVLNNDFQKANAELKNGVYLGDYQLADVANCQIEFKVKTTIRKTTSVTSFSTNDAVKFTSQGGSDAVDPTSALNMWVCDLSGGLLGYAQFPGGSASTDGIVVDFKAFGTTASYSLYLEFNKGRTATHEIGHWLNLRHIWGDTRCGNDYVEDTPLHDGPNYGCPGTTDRSFCKGKISADMWMNFMDYTDDACMYMFSAKQKERMDLTLANARSGYYTTSAKFAGN